MKAGYPTNSHEMVVFLLACRVAQCCACKQSLRGSFPVPVPSSILILQHHQSNLFALDDSTPPIVQVKVQVSIAWSKLEVFREQRVVHQVECIENVKTVTALQRPLKFPG
jgi:hypothetical protein